MARGSKMAGETGPRPGGAQAVPGAPSRSRHRALARRAGPRRPSRHIAVVAWAAGPKPSPDAWSELAHAGRRGRVGRAAQVPAAQPAGRRSGPPRHARKRPVGEGAGRQSRGGQLGGRPGGADQAGPDALPPAAARRGPGRRRECGLVALDEQARGQRPGVVRLGRRGVPRTLGARCPRRGGPAGGGGVGARRARGARRAGRAALAAAGPAIVDPRWRWASRGASPARAGVGAGAARCPARPR